MKGNDFIIMGSLLVEKGKTLIAYGEQLNGNENKKPIKRQIAKAKSDEIVKAMERVILLDHNARVKKKRDTENRNK